MNFLVPYDFTPVTRTALEYALQIARVFNARVEILHIIPDENEREEARSKLDDLIAEFGAEAQKRLITKVRIGSIFKDISREATEGDAQLLVMGTHGAKGLQKLLGSHAIKVITSSNIPFIVTQNKGPGKAVEQIVLPVDLSRESVQIVKFATELAKKFGAEVHLVCKPEDDEFLRHRLSNNITRARRYLKQNDVAHNVHILDGNKAFYREVIDYGEEKGADLFAVAHFSESLLPQFDSFSQELITNKPGIPVLISNAQQVTNSDHNYSFLSI